MAIHMPGNALSEATASSLCEAASKRGQLHSSSHHADSQRWFSSPGGKAVPPDDIANVISSDRPTESPPSYDDLGRSSPDPHESSASRKRIRTSSGGYEKPFDADIAVDSMDIAGRVVDRLQELVLKAEKKEALLKERIGEADQRLVWLAEATAEDKESQLGEKQYVDDRIEETRLEIRGFIDERFDDLGVDVVLKAEMEDCVDEGLRATEDDLRARLSRSGVGMILGV